MGVDNGSLCAMELRLRVEIPVCMKFYQNTSGLGCSKLMMLVNVSLKFQTFESEIHQHFLLKKCEKLLHCKSFSHFSTKNIGVFGYKVINQLTKAC